VGDLLRSTSYVYPVVLIALAIICKNEGREMIRRYCLFAFIISAIAGSYNVFLGQITWFMPLPVMIINKAAHLLYEVFRYTVFHGMP
jgi:disulfide bond formation protein DsbB